MAKTNSTTTPATDVLNALLDIKGAIQLCQQATSNDTSGSETIPAPCFSPAWPRDEVANG